jgi:hypothetical protein
MAPRNVYFENGTKSEQELYEDLIIEAMKIYGNDVSYIPRKIIKKDLILNEDLISEFNNAFKIEMYIDSIDGFEGDGKLMSKFGLEIRDQITLVVAERSWNQLIGRFGYTEGSARPREGDLIYIPRTQGLFEIKFVEDKKPFLQLGNAPTFKLICELFEYESQEIDTGISEVDAVQTLHTQTFKFEASLNGQFNLGENLTFVLPTGITGSTEFVGYETFGSPEQYNVTVGVLTFDDGEFHTLAPGTVLTGSDSGSSATVIDIYDLAETDSTNFENDIFAQNSAFTNDVNTNDFIDFSESNPFGEPFSF